MSGKLIVMAGLAVVFGSTSYFAGNQYLEGQTQARIDQLESRKSTEIQLSQIVVATKPLTFGEILSEENLKLVPWPKETMPAGAFTSIAKVVDNGERKAIQSIEPNEPILNVKLTGENSRAGLAGIIADGMRAVTIPVNSIDGVGGFIMPGDRVDIIFSQRDRETGKQTARVIMGNVKVLSVDQTAGSRSTGPKIAKSVTLEMDAQGAQKIALAKNSGKLSLLLRAAGDVSAISDEAISFDESAAPPTLENEGEQEDQKGFLSFLDAPEEKQTSVKVVAGPDIISKSVPIHKVLKKTQKKTLGGKIK